MATELNTVKVSKVKRTNNFHEFTDITNNYSGLLTMEKPVI
jgi:hypothetical protein